jgi:hypothetical protein
MYVSCDIKLGDVYIFDTTVLCNRDVLTHEAVGVTVYGATSIAKILMTDTRINLRLSNTFISSSAPITVQRSNASGCAPGGNRQPREADPPTPLLSGSNSLIVFVCKSRTATLFLTEHINSRACPAG